MHYLVIINFLFFSFLSFLSSEFAFSAVKIKGGVITSAEVLKTVKPNKRDDLIIDLNKIDLVHLDKKISIAEAIRFENRIGIGAPYDRIKRYIGVTRKDAIKLIVKELKQYSDDFDWPNWSDSYIPTQFFQNGFDRNKIYCSEDLFRSNLELLWSKSILTNKVPQFEKLALFWLDHFSVAFDEYKQTHSFLYHLKFIRKFAKGNFGEFLKQSIRDPGVIVYLNNEQSTTQNPNENLAREFLELFSLGEGNYTEKEIKNFAKKLPSHGINHVSQQFQYYKYKESGQTLSAFGKNFSSPDEFIDLVINHPAFGEFIAKKFYREYVSLEEPSKKELAILVSSFRESDFSIIKLFETTISLKKFWDEDNRLTLVKSPIELVFGTARTLGVRSWKNHNIDWLVSLSKEFGQDIYNPPNIAGWPSGKEWLSGQFLEKRMTKLKGNFLDLDSFKKIQKNTNSTPTNYISNTQKYNNELNEFYETTFKDQLAVETIIIDWLPDDFEERAYANVNVRFYGVKFNEKFWKGIDVRFGTDKNSKKKQKHKRLNYIEFRHGYNYPSIFSSWEGSWISNWDGHYGWNSSFPFGPKINNFSAKSLDEKLLMVRLLQSMEHLLNYPKASKKLKRNSYFQNWLKERIIETKSKKWSIKNSNHPNTKIFSFASIHAGGEKRKFLCGPQKAGINLSNQRLLDNHIINSLPSNFIQQNEIDITDLLLPEIDLGLNAKEFMSILSYEGYQLK